MKILPDQARKDEAITLFSPEEAERDLQENGKFNKRNAEVIRKELARLNRIKPLEKNAESAKANEDSDVDSDYCFVDGNQDVEASESDDDEPLQIPEQGQTNFGGFGRSVSGSKITIKTCSPIKPSQPSDTVPAFKPPAFMRELQERSQVKIAGSSAQPLLKPIDIFQINRNAKP